MTIVAILQARMNSTRLPGKMLLPLLDKPLVQHVIERVRRTTKLDTVVLAYPLHDHPSFMPVLRSFVDTPGVALGSWAGQGDENDLIERYLGAARAYDADVLVRIPCDNPCVDPACIDAAISTYLYGPPYPFVTNADVAQVGDTYVDGIGCEVFSISRLKWLDQITKSHVWCGKPAFREHIHKVFQQYSMLCESVGHVPSKASLRLDVNTQADYEFVQSIYDHFGHNHFTAAEIVAYLATQEVPHATQARVESESH